MGLTKFRRTFFIGMLALIVCGGGLSPILAHAQRSATESEDTQVSESGLDANDIFLREMARRQRELARRQRELSGVGEMDIGAMLARAEEKKRNELLLRLTPLFLLLIGALLRFMNSAEKAESETEGSDEGKSEDKEA